MITPRSGVKDKLSKILPSSSSAMVNQKNPYRNSFRSARPEIFPRNTEIGAPLKLQKLNTGAKVNIRPGQEAINLKSGTKAVTQVTHGNLGVPTNLGRIATSAIGSVAVTKGATDRPTKPVALTARVELGSCESLEKPKDPRGKEDGLVPRRRSFQEGPADGATLSKKVEACTISENSTCDSGTVPLLFVMPPSISSSGVNIPSGPSSIRGILHERNLQKISSNSQRQSLRGPALKIIWKGSFEILDFSREGDNRFFEGFLAHPSARISRKAYEFGKQIAEVLQFRIHPRRAFWPEIFQSDYPDSDDIALFFYPGNVERSRRQYSSLLKHIDNHDLLLRSLMGDVELLVFPSKLLPVDSQKLDGSYFMWGVFRHLTGNEVAIKAESSSSITRCSVTSNASPETGSSRKKVVQGQEQKGRW